jgi:uncharacterized integral membrane protein
VTPEPAPEETGLGRHRRAVARLGTLAVLVAVAVSFVLENDQKVRVRLWFVTGHPRLIWVLVVTVVVGAVIGYLVGVPRRRRARAEPGQPGETGGRRRRRRRD